ncbi:hypothetical protein H4219_005247 [Mycoemilia scoparia]|uniref:Signal recognition particle receptor subunit beta n=1 Tax=Mycoemilia scoparia TaxID=417184 RepID=A0A9W7ZWX4_9FUNG|nr:hypothetical protein H4219_005247 [Mycoemilia scoparia]
MFVSGNLMSYAALLYLAFGIVAAVVLKYFVLSETIRKPKKNTILILGTTKSGKTTLWAYFRYHRLIPTQTSMEKNEVEKPIHCKEKSVVLHLMDIPGHPKLRNEFHDYTPITKGIIFMVNSSTLKSDIQEVGENLYDVLADKHVQKLEIPILVACHKQDLKGSLDRSDVENILAQEIDKLRSTRQSSLQKHDNDHGNNNGDGDDDADETTEFLGFENKKFSFEDLVNHVTFVESGTRYKNEDFGGFSDINEWVVELFD